GSLRLLFLGNLVSQRGNIPRGTLLLKFLRGRPVHQCVRDLFPLAALRAQIAHPVALDLVPGDRLIRAVLHDEALGERLGMGLRGEPQGRQEKDPKPKRTCARHNGSSVYFRCKSGRDVESRVFPSKTHELSRNQQPPPSPSWSFGSFVLAPTTG